MKGTGRHGQEPVICSRRSCRAGDIALVPAKDIMHDQQPTATQPGEPAMSAEGSSGSGGPERGAAAPPLPNVDDLVTAAASAIRSALDGSRRAASPIVGPTKTVAAETGPAVADPEKREGWVDQLADLFDTRADTKLETAGVASPSEASSHSTSAALGSVDADRPIPPWRAWRTSPQPADATAPIEAKPPPRLADAPAAGVTDYRQSPGHGIAAALFAHRPGERWLASAAAAASRAIEMPKFDAGAAPFWTGAARRDREPAGSAMADRAAVMAAQDNTAGAETTRDGDSRRSRRRDFLRLARRGVRYLAIGFGVWLLATLAAIALFRFVDPPGSMLMLSQRITGGDIEQRWVPLDAISPQIVRAVVASEDSRFCRHWGIDPQEIAAAIERARDGIPRGASTITMQVAKNLFLWPSKSYLRKALELPLTLAIELLWSKSRVMEVYLNIAEWGPGVFGIEAAAAHHFSKPAKALSRAEAALLAVSLPNPLLRNASRPGPGMKRLARLIETRVQNDPRAASCVVGEVVERSGRRDARQDGNSAIPDRRSPPRPASTQRRQPWPETLE